MWGSLRYAALAILPAAGLLAAAGANAEQQTGDPAFVSGGYNEVQVEQVSTRLAYVVFHATDRDGFCDAAAFGAVSLHPVLTDAPNDTMVNGTTGLPNPRATLDVFIDSGDGVIIETSSGPAGGVRGVAGLKTFSTYDNIQAGSPLLAFPPLVDGVQDECQAWVKVASSTGGPANVLSIFHDDNGDLGFDRLVNAPPATTVRLTPRWSLVSWTGADNVPPSDALAGAGAAKGGSDITSSVSAIYAWDNTTSKWLAYFPGSGAIPGANTLTSLSAGQPYWFAISGPAAIEWKVAAGK